MADQDKPEDTAAPADVEETSPETADVPETSEGPADTADVAETGGDPANVPDVAGDEATSAPDAADPDQSGTVAPADSGPDSEAVAAAPGAVPAADAAPVEDKARKARKPRSDAQKAKRKADDARRKTAITAAQDARPKEVEDPEAERKAKIREELEAIDDDMNEALEHVAKCRARTKHLISELYPAMKANDRHVDAVRGYIAAEKKSRANRALAPARLKAMLEQAGKSPIDAAFSVQRARGFSRPTRKVVGVGAGDTAGDAAGSQE